MLTSRSDVCEYIWWEWMVVRERIVHHIIYAWYIVPCTFVRTCRTVSTSWLSRSLHRPYGSLNFQSGSTSDWSTSTNTRNKDASCRYLNLTSRANELFRSLMMEASKLFLWGHPSGGEWAPALELHYYGWLRRKFCARMTPGVGLHLSARVTTKTGANY